MEERTSGKNVVSSSSCRLWGVEVYDEVLEHTWTVECAHNIIMENYAQLHIQLNREAEIIIPFNCSCHRGGGEGGIFTMGECWQDDEEVEVGY